MKTAEEILESKIKPRYKPDGFGGFKELIIEAMKEYALQYLGQTFIRECKFCKNNAERLKPIHFPNYPECCKGCFPVPNQFYKFELP